MIALVYVLHSVRTGCRKCYVHVQMLMVTLSTFPCCWTHTFICPCVILQVIHPDACTSSITVPALLLAVAALLLAVAALLLVVSLALLLVASLLHCTLGLAHEDGGLGVIAI